MNKILHDYEQKSRQIVRIQQNFRKAKELPLSPKYSRHISPIQSMSKQFDLPLIPSSNSYIAHSRNLPKMLSRHELADRDEILAQRKKSKKESQKKSLGNYLQTISFEKKMEAESKSLFGMRKMLREKSRYGRDYSEEGWKNSQIFFNIAQQKYNNLSTSLYKYHQQYNSIESEQDLQQAEFDEFLPKLPQSQSPPSKLSNSMNLTQRSQKKGTKGEKLFLTTILSRGEKLQEKTKFTPWQVQNENDDMGDILKSEQI